MNRSIVLLLACLAAAASPARANGPIDPTDWSRRMRESREATAKSADAAAADALALDAWKKAAAAAPICADWILQDLGDQAPSLFHAARATEAESRLLQQVKADPQGGDAFARYVESATARRRERIASTMENWGPLAFTEGHTYRMSFIGYTEGLSDARHERFFKPGARLSVLSFDDGSLFGTHRTLIDDPNGMMRDVDVSFDRKRLLFAWKKSDRLDDYHVYEYNLKSAQARQLTRGLGRADYEPVYLPDGDIIFTSTRPEQSVPCWWTEISNLYRMDGEGRFIRRLAIDQVHALYPQLLADGRVTYTRWDYSDRGQNYPHPVFSMRPDGQDQRAFYGANSWFPTSLLHTRGIPDSHKAISIAAGHHTLQQGKLVILDVTKGRDEGPGMSFVAPVRDVPYERVDVAMQNGELFRYPYAFSETEYLVSFKPAWGADRFGLYWMNAAGERELLHVDDQLDIARMVPLGRRPLPKKIPEDVAYGKDTGTYYVHDVYKGMGLQGIPRGDAKKIRVVRLNYRAAGIGQSNNEGEGGRSLNSTPVSVANGTWDVKEILGDVDIHPDGSALFEVPAMQSIYLQVLDDRGRVIQTTRTWDTLRPGEQKACAGCHEKADANFYPFKREHTLAWEHGIQKLQPFYGETRGFSFNKEIQPILDRNCISCHDGSKPDVMDLRGEPVPGENLNRRAWSKAYVNLLEAKRENDGNYRATPETGIVSWISKMSRPTELPPYFAGAAKSTLLPLLDAGHYGVKITEEDYHKLAAWMDLLVPFSGDYWEGNQWNDQQKAYYGYYEGKRTEQAKEEQAAVMAYMRGIFRRAHDPASLAPFTQTSYREVLRGVSLPATPDAAPLPAQEEAVMIDRVWLSGPQGAEVFLHSPRKNAELARVRLGADTQLVMLKEPVRSDVMRVSVEGAAAGASSVRIDRALGVPVRELPLVNGFHPFLDHADPALPVSQAK